jgi:hypothetical protein
MADSEMKRFPELWQYEYGKRLYFGYTQGKEGNPYRDGSYKNYIGETVLLDCRDGFVFLDKQVYHGCFKCRSQQNDNDGTVNAFHEPC